MLYSVSSIESVSFTLRNKLLC